MDPQRRRRAPELLDRHITGGGRRVSQVHPLVATGDASRHAERTSAVDAPRSTPARKVAAAASATDRCPSCRVGDAAPHVPERTQDRDGRRLLRVGGGDRDLDDPLTRGDRVDQQLGVEREPLGVAEERKRLQARPRVRAHAAVHVREPGAEHEVLRRSGDPVAEVAVPRHAASERIAHTGEPRAERHVGIAGKDRRDQQRHGLRLVLVVGMQQDHDVGIRCERQRVARLLVRSVPTVERVHVHLQAEPASQIRRSVTARVVHQDELVGHARRDREHRPLQRPLGLVGGHRDHHLGTRRAPIDGRNGDGNQPRDRRGGHLLSLGRRRLSP